LWTPDPAGLLELWRHEGPRTRRIFRVFANADLDFRPSAASRSVGELLGHIIRSYSVTRHWLLRDTEDGVPNKCLPASVEEAANRLMAAQNGLFAVLEALTAASFLTEIAPFGVRETRAIMALGMLKHEIHHRGELYALARVRGLTPPGLYEPVQD
jgi:uncharacterized damage-inducible protein DinB